MQVNAIRNPEGVLVNTNCFREEALHFLKVGYYTPDKWGSPAWKEYWEEQLRRCAEGYSSGGVRVTGDHYAYLNFGQIKITQEFKNAEEAVVADRKPKSRILKNLKRGAQKVVTFPSFWDMDYNYYWVLDIARWGIAPRDMHALELQINPLHLDGGYHIIVGKSRRKGFSYKNGFVAANRYNTVRNSITLIGAFDKKYLFPEGTMKMTGDYINFFNEFTGWAKARDYVDKTDHKKASYSEKDDNSITVEKGYKSTVMALSFKDNPEAAIGKDGTLVLFEEAGKFPNLEEAYMKTKPAMEDGIYTTGQMLIFGCLTAGNKIWTKDGKLINIEELQSSDGILGYNGNSISKEDIIHIKPPTEKSCYRIKTTSGYSIECSNDHPLLVTNRNNFNVTFHKAEDITVGQQLLIADEINVFGSDTVLDASLLGLLIGDGYYGDKATPQLAIADEDIFEYVSNYNISIYKQFNQSSGKPYWYVGIKDFIDTMKSYGIYGQTGFDKRLPDNIHDFDRQSLAKFLGGYFDADGNVSYNQKKNTVRIVLTSKVYELLEQVKYQLHKFGIHSNIVKEDRGPGGYGGNSTIYRLYISKRRDVIRFRENIKFLSRSKQTVLNNISVKNERYRRNLVFRVNPGNGKGSYFADKDISGYKYETVKSITYVGYKPVYNLTTSDTHTYIANGFITANTGGDMEVGSVDFANMFYNPEPYRLMQFKNVWDDKVSEEAKCGFFVPDYWCKPGFIDGDGNSDTDSAKKYELKKRADLIASTSGATALNAYLTQYPFTPEEAFLRSSMNDFPVVELRTQLAKVRAEQLHVKHGQPVSMSYVDGRVALTPDLKNELTPLYHHPNKEKDTTGCVIIYEAPVPNAPKGLYKAGYDPYRQDQSQGASLGSMYVYKSRNSFSYTGDTLVAEYVGRPASTDTFNRNVMLLSMAYNLELMHENEVTEVKNYFRQQRKLHLLAAQPDAVISKNIKNSRVSRIYGCHMNDKLKDAGAKYIKKWLLTVRDHDEEGVKIINIETIKSPALLEELIGFNMKENFDRVMSLMMVMFQLEEDDYKEYKSDDKHTIAKQLADMSFFSRVAI